jgi:anti-sigma factor RsiW
MTTHLDDRLDAWLDGELPPDERQETERHLTECPECRATADRLRGLRDAAAGLPRELAPGRDLWPDVARRLNEPAVVPFTARLRALGPLQLAAAATVLMALSSAVTLVAVRRPSAVPEQTLPEALVLRTAVTGDAPALDVELDYERAATELVAALNARGAALSPETRAALSRGLSQIDEALGEIRAALVKDPASGELMRLLTNTHKRRVDMLRRVARLSRT